MRRAVLLTVLAAVVITASRGQAASPDAVAANEAGSRLFRAGTTAEAIAAFEEALALDPGFEPARHNLAVALATRGQQQLQAGNFDDARTSLERAVDLAPGEAAYHLLLGVLHSRRGDLYESRQRIDRALELAPELAEAREISGDLHYQQGSLERARAEWERALAGSGSQKQALSAKLDRVVRELNAEGGFGRDVSRHFTIQYDGPVPREVARTALELLEGAYDRLWRDFGRSPQHDVPVILYTRDLFNEITRSPGWVGGTYDGKIRVPVGGLQTEDDARRLGPVLAHELTHAFIRANVPGHLPLWFEEGLAGHFEGTTRAAAQNALRAAGGGFATLDEVSAALRGGPRVGAAYAAAALAVGEMVRRNGFWLPSRTLDLVASGRPFPQAFHDVSGIELAEFEEGWVRAQR
jgi:tetratricopeptide (TPR) repeat protein